MTRVSRIALGAILAGSAWSAAADDLTGADQLLCAAVQATVCGAAAAECRSGPPWNWNIPQFIEIDLKRKLLSTTEASGEQRQTPIKTTDRGEGRIMLQGMEMGRAFSFVIDEVTGIAAVAVARDGLTVSVFGTCTVKGVR